MRSLLIGLTLSCLVVAGAAVDLVQILVACAQLEVHGGLRLHGLDLDLRSEHLPEELQQLEFGYDTVGAEVAHGSLRADGSETTALRQIGTELRELAGGDAVPAVVREAGDLPSRRLLGADRSGARADAPSHIGGLAWICRDVRIGRSRHRGQFDAIQA